MKRRRSPNTLLLYPIGGWRGGKWQALSAIVYPQGGGYGSNSLKHGREFHSRGLVMRYLRKYAQHHKRLYARVFVLREWPRFNWQKAIELAEAEQLMAGVR